MDTLVRRVAGALMLDNATYEEVEHDPAALQQATIVVVAAALVSGVIGGAASGGHFVAGLAGHMAGTFVGWFVLALAVWLVGTRVFDGDADLQQMLRVTGFAYAPVFFSAVPCVNLLVAVWLLATGFVAVRAGLDLDNAETIVTIVISVVAVIAVRLAILIPLGLGRALLGALF